MMSDESILELKKRLDDAFVKAAFRGETEEALALLNQGADIHARDDLGLRWAVYEGNLETVKALLAHGADVHAMDNWALNVVASGWAADTKMAEILQKAVVSSSIFK